MAKALSESAAANIRKNIDGVTADKKGIPGCVAVVVGKDGKTIFSHASGNKGSETQDPMTLDTVFWIASCTKMIGGIAVMQLVEQGKLALDDADLVEKICPELKDVKILQDVDAKGKPTFVEKKNRITLKMLLTHTGMASQHGLTFSKILTFFRSWLRVCGSLAAANLPSSQVFSYTFFNDKLRRWGLPTGIDEISGHPRDVLGLPLTFEPGTKWEYGVCHNTQPCLTVSTNKRTDTE